MSLPKIVRSSIRRLRSVLILAVTISLLFYYTFENEIDMLNSYAENEYTPSIKTGSRLKSISGSPDARVEGDSDKAGLATTDLKVLREKNKYFPLLVSEPSKDPSKLLESISDLDLSALATHKEKYPVLNEALLPFRPADESQFKLQSSDFEDNGLEDSDMLLKIRQLFESSWKQQNLIEGISEYHWPLPLIDSLDSLFMMGEMEAFNRAVDAISSIDFTMPPSSVEMVDIPDVGNRALGGLLSAYELSMNITLLKKAIDVGNFLLRAFDTPNRIPLLKYYWKSKLDNKFPYQKSDVGLLTSMTLEFIRLSQLTHENKFYDAAQRVYLTISSSLDEFDLEHLLPIHVDASGCSLISSAEIKLGKHLTDLNGMKSIDENLQLIHCQQTGKFVSLSRGGVRAEQLFNMDASAQSIFSNLVKSFQLLKGNDLLKFADDRHEPEARKEDKAVGVGYETSELDDKTASLDLHDSKHIFVKAMESVKNLMAFHPATPSNENITMITSLKTKRWVSPATNEMHVEVTRYFDMKFERCSLASTLVLGSKMFGIPSYANFADDLATGCFQLMKLFGGLQPVELYMDRCENEDCSFDINLKTERANNGFYYHADYSKPGVLHQEDISTPNGDRYEEPRQKVLVFAMKQGPSFYDLGELEVDVKTKQWKQDPRRPLWVNRMGLTSLLAPNAIEAVYYLYRATGESKWREMGREMYQMTIDNLVILNGGAKGVWKVNELYDDGNGMALSLWLSQTLKYFFLLFSDSSYLTLDEYVFTAGGHILKSNDAMHL